MKFRLMPGEFYSYKCLGCGEVNGGGIISETHTKEQAESDLDCPVNRPCVWCGKGPVVVEMTGETSTGEEI